MHTKIIEALLGNDVVARLDDNEKIFMHALNEDMRLSFETFGNNDIVFLLQNADDELQLPPRLKITYIPKNINTKEEAFNYCSQIFDISRQVSEHVPMVDAIFYPASNPQPFAFIGYLSRLSNISITFGIAIKEEFLIN